MKNKKIIYLILLIFTTLIGLWGLPELVKTVSYSKSRYPFVYFSSIEKKLLFKEFDERDKPWFHDDEGKKLTEDEYDSALPLLNFRQLTVNREMPDSIDGIAIDSKLLRVKQVNFRYAPKEKNKPEIGLYIMYESMPKKAKLESPGDVFRLKDKVEFIDAKTNTVNKEKSEKFQSALLRAGYTFPARWIYGNLNIRKPYDEGYFSLDAQTDLYHIKMVNGRPFVRNTQIDPAIDAVYFSMLEAADKRFYGFLFDKQGDVYILEEDAGKYKALKLDIDRFNWDTDEMMILGNFLYWTVAVQTASGKHFYALDSETLSQKRHAYVEAPVNRWDVIASRLFPAYLSFKNNHSEFMAPYLHFTGYTAFCTNLLAALLMAFVFPRKTKKKKFFDLVYTLVFGIAGAVALLTIPNFSTKNKQ